MRDIHSKHVLISAEQFGWGESTSGQNAQDAGHVTSTRFLWILDVLSQAHSDIRLRTRKLAC